MFTLAGDYAAPGVVCTFENELGSEGIETCFRVAITRLNGKIIEEYYFDSEQTAKSYFELMITEEKYRPSLIVLFDEDGLVMDAHYIKKDPLL